MEATTRAGTVIIVEREGRHRQVALERSRGGAAEASRVPASRSWPSAARTRSGRFVFALRRERPEVVLRSLCDEREEPDFRRALERAGFGRDLDRAGLERLGFHVCIADLEDELIRALKRRGRRARSSGRGASFHRCAACNAARRGTQLDPAPAPLHQHPLQAARRSTPGRWCSRWTWTACRVRSTPCSVGDSHNRGARDAVRAR